MVRELSVFSVLALAWGPAALAASHDGAAAAPVTLDRVASAPGLDVQAVQARTLAWSVDALPGDARVAVVDGALHAVVTVPVSPALHLGAGHVAGGVDVHLVITPLDGGAHAEVEQLVHHADTVDHALALGVLTTADDPGAGACGEVVHRSAACQRGHADLCVVTTCDADYRSAALQGVRAQASAAAAALLDGWQHALEAGPAGA